MAQASSREISASVHITKTLSPSPIPTELAWSHTAYHPQNFISLLVSRILELDIAFRRKIRRRPTFPRRDILPENSSSKVLNSLSQHRSTWLQSFGPNRGEWWFIESSLLLTHSPGQAKGAPPRNPCHQIEPQHQRPKAWKRDEVGSHLNDPDSSVCELPQKQHPCCCKPHLLLHLAFSSTDLPIHRTHSMSWTKKVWAEWSPWSSSTHDDDDDYPPPPPPPPFSPQRKKREIPRKSAALLGHCCSIPTISAAPEHMGTPSPSPLPRPPFVMILDTYFLLFPTKRIIIYFIPTSCLQPKYNSLLASNKKDPWLLWKSNTSLFLPLFVFGDCMLLLTTSCLCAILGRGLGFRWGVSPKWKGSYFLPV